MNDNLPTWPGAAHCYSKAYSLLNTMAKAGHVTVLRRGRKARRCTVSGEMESLIDALNKGDEERIKAALLFPNYHATSGHQRTKKGTR